ncbi:MAG: hypothetical protein MRERC_6c070 [Mycoplasmataceae bacterium RC_NB112A]|nr:MAG: hypothetical protein MRERC_10c026 [Mycoplasmataceae bacterium RC_NB112A]KLL01960.1 MAG: hypothetical protein MRERC_6c051 [Mycoplasmataceae bacterium RC_NB112A]KLL01975.1 MAG: hypothetical protein MRERC_6c070 [Mycoplasmataceae bacterium RC_NB112A]
MLNESKIKSVIKILFTNRWEYSETRVKKCEIEKFSSKKGFYFELKGITEEGTFKIKNEVISNDLGEVLEYCCEKQEEIGYLPIASNVFASNEEGGKFVLEINSNLGWLIFPWRIFEEHLKEKLQEVKETVEGLNKNLNDSEVYKGLKEKYNRECCQESVLHYIDKK